jgi:hypothetical protein
LGAVKNKAAVFLGRWRVFNNFGRPTSRSLLVTSVVEPRFKDGLWDGSAMVEGIERFPLRLLSRAIHEGTLRRA